MIVRDNPLDAYMDAIIHGSGVWRSGEVDDERQPIDEYRGEVPPYWRTQPNYFMCTTGEFITVKKPEPATDPYEIDTP